MNNRIAGYKKWRKIVYANTLYSILLTVITSLSWLGDEGTFLRFLFIAAILVSSGLVYSLHSSWITNRWEIAGHVVSGIILSVLFLALAWSSNSVFSSGPVQAYGLFGLLLIVPVILLILFGSQSLGLLHPKTRDIFWFIPTTNHMDSRFSRIPMFTRSRYRHQICG